MVVLVQLVSSHTNKKKFKKMVGWVGLVGGLVGGLTTAHWDSCRHTPKGGERWKQRHTAEDRRKRWTVLDWREQRGARGRGRGGERGQEGEGRAEQGQASGYED